jgi:hypothetical protein
VCSPLPELPPEFFPARSLLLPFIVRYVNPGPGHTTSRFTVTNDTNAAIAAFEAAAAAEAAGVAGGMDPLAQHSHATDPATAPTAVLPSATAASAALRPAASSGVSVGTGGPGGGSLVDPSMVRQLVRVCDMRLPHEWYPYARCVPACRPACACLAVSCRVFEPCSALRCFLGCLA